MSSPIWSSELLDATINGNLFALAGFEINYSDVYATGSTYTPSLFMFGNLTGTVTSSVFRYAYANHLLSIGGSITFSNVTFTGGPSVGASLNVQISLPTGYTARSTNVFTTLAPLQSTIPNDVTLTYVYYSYPTAHPTRPLVLNLYSTIPLVTYTISNRWSFSLVLPVDKV